MKVAIITDTHWGVRNDSQVFYEYFRKFYTDVFFPELEKREIKTVWMGGDTFDRRKFINFKTLQTAKEIYFDRLAERGIDTHVIVGNHDTSYKNTNSPNSPDLCLGEYENITLYPGPQEVMFDSLNVLMVPWINSDNYSDSVDLIRKTKASVLLGHLEVQGFEMYKNGYRNIDGMSPDVFDKFEYAFSGHYHTKSDDGNVFYLGAPCEYTWSDYNDRRGFHIFDTETRELEYIKNPYSMFYKLYYDDEKETYDNLSELDFSEYTGKDVKVIVENKSNPYIFDLYLDKIQAINPYRMKVIENIDLSTDDDDFVDETESTVDTLVKYVDKLKIKNKKELKALMRTLYNEALDMEIS